MRCWHGSFLPSSSWRLHRPTDHILLRTTAKRAIVRWLSVTSHFAAVGIGIGIVGVSAPCPIRLATLLASRPVVAEAKQRTLTPFRLALKRHRGGKMTANACKKVAPLHADGICYTPRLLPRLNRPIGSPALSPIGELALESVSDARACHSISGPCPLWRRHCCSSLPCQILAILLMCRFVVFTALGRDYDAAVIGVYRLALGATPAAVANMSALTHHYGAWPRRLSSWRWSALLRRSTERCRHQRRASAARVISGGAAGLRCALAAAACRLTRSQLR